LLKTRLFTLFLFAVFVVPVTASFIVLKKQQRQIKREVKWKLIESLDKSELVMLKFSKDETKNSLSWKHAKEFEYHGNYFDIADFLEINDSIYYWCWWDKEETILSNKLRSLLTMTFQQDWGQKNKLKFVQSVLKSMYFESNLNSPNISFTVKKQNSFNLLVSINLFEKNLDAPPP
jgi:hypothetical protein